MPDILIAPQRGTSNNPQIFFTGSVQTSASIRMEVLPEGQIAFLGKSGSLFSISDSMVGSLMAVSDISGLPILEVFSDDKVVMGKYNSNALVVTGSSVSIGKSVPNAKLDVTGSAVITGSLGVTGTTTVSGVSATGVINTSSTEALRINNSSGYISIYNTAGTTRTGYLQGNTANSIVLAAENSSTLQFNVAGSEKVRIDVNGNVGIGTTTPSSKLHILGTSSTAITITDDALYVNSITNDNAVMTYTVDTGNTAAGSAVHVFKRYTSELVRIDQNGNVGIGTTSPTGRLQIHNASGNTIAAYKDAGGAAIALGSTTGPTNYALIESINGGGVRFYTGNGTQTEKVRIDVNGNVGIGTAAPRAALDVTGNIIQSWANNQLNVAQYLTGTQYKMGLESDSNNRVLYIQNQDADNVPTRASIQFRTGSTPSTVVTIQQNGNVGIGASSPTAKLQVNGDVMADNVFNPFLLMGA